MQEIVDIAAPFVSICLLPTLNTYLPMMPSKRATIQERDFSKKKGY